MLNQQHLGYYSGDTTFTLLSAASRVGGWVAILINPRNAKLGPGTHLIYLLYSWDDGIFIMFRSPLKNISPILVLQASRKACSKKTIGGEKNLPKFTLTFTLGFYTIHNPLSGG
jgi:hypothetical protein